MMGGGGSFSAGGPGKGMYTRLYTRVLNKVFETSICKASGVYISNLNSVFPWWWPPPPPKSFIHSPSVPLDVFCNSLQPRLQWFWNILHPRLLTSTEPGWTHTSKDSKLRLIFTQNSVAWWCCFRYWSESWWRSQVESQRRSWTGPRRRCFETFYFGEIFYLFEWT